MKNNDIFVLTLEKPCKNRRREESAQYHHDDDDRIDAIVNNTKRTANGSENKPNFAARDHADTNQQFVDAFASGITGHHLPNKGN